MYYAGAQMLRQWRPSCPSRCLAVAPDGAQLADMTTIPCETGVGLPGRHSAELCRLVQKAIAAGCLGVPCGLEDHGGVSKI